VSFSDSINLIREQVQWTPKGVKLITKWHFDVGTEVEFAFDHGGKKHCCVGVVVACRPLRHPAGHYDTVLYFIEVPCSHVQKAACDCRLAADQAQSNSTAARSRTAARDGAGPMLGRSRYS
jgi:hypothetical protein